MKLSGNERGNVAKRNGILYLLYVWNSESERGNVAKKNGILYSKKEKEFRILVSLLTFQFYLYVNIFLHF